MTFTEAQILFSKARMQKYLNACGGDEQKAMIIYEYNTRLSEYFFGVLGIFEIILRNAINRHYLEQLGNDWIINQVEVGGLLEHDVEEVQMAERAFRRNGVYSHDKMVGSFTFGFWTYLFTKRNYRLGGKTLLQIFPNRPKGTMQRKVYEDITRIREFRNRVAHHEPICFNSDGQIDLNYIQTQYMLIKDYLTYLGVMPQSVLKIVESPDLLMTELESLME